MLDVFETDLIQVAPWPTDLRFEDDPKALERDYTLLPPRPETRAPNGTSLGDSSWRHTFTDFGDSRNPRLTAEDWLLAKYNRSKWIARNGRKL